MPPPLLLLLLPLLLNAATALRPELPAGAAWANLAWGFAGGGADDVRRAKLVLLDIDMYADPEGVVGGMHRDDRLVICYLSAGTVEGFRDFYAEDRATWDALALGRMTGFEDERWLDLRRMDEVMRLMAARLELFAEVGCDAVEPDNMDCYAADECAGRMEDVSAAAGRAMSLEFARRLAGTAHALGMSILVKNAVELHAELLPDFDGVLLENCARWRECDSLGPWLAAGKAALAVEYGADRCGAGHPAGARVKVCDGNSGGYLCVDGAWRDCAARPAALPETRFVGWLDDWDSNATFF